MAKTKCKDKDYKEKEGAAYICKRCERSSKKEEKICRPKKIKESEDHDHTGQ